MLAFCMQSKGDLIMSASKRIMQIKSVIVEVPIPRNLSLLQALKRVPAGISAEELEKFPWKVHEQNGLVKMALLEFAGAFSPFTQQAWQKAIADAGYIHATIADLLCFAAHPDYERRPFVIFALGSRYLLPHCSVNVFPALMPNPVTQMPTITTRILGDFYPDNYRYLALPL